jgi:nitrite reductase (NADH) large subunit
MLYVQEADRLQRTAPWVDGRPGGLDELRRVIVEDSAGVAEQLDRAMADAVLAYEDEWSATLADPAKLRKFVSFVNAPGVADPDLAFVPERGQVRPADETDEVVFADPRTARDVAMEAL